MLPTEVLFEFFMKDERVSFSSFQFSVCARVGSISGGGLNKGVPL